MLHIIPGWLLTPCCLCKKYRLTSLQCFGNYITQQKHNIIFKISSLMTVNVALLFNSNLQMHFEMKIINYSHVFYVFKTNHTIIIQAFVYCRYLQYIIIVFCLKSSSRKLLTLHRYVPLNSVVGRKILSARCLLNLLLPSTSYRRSIRPRNRSPTVCGGLPGSHW